MNYKNIQSLTFLSPDSGYPIGVKVVYTSPETRIAFIESTGFICVSIQNETRVTSINVGETNVKSYDITFDADVE